VNSDLHGSEKYYKEYKLIHRKDLKLNFPDCKRIVVLLNIDAAWFG